MYLFYGTIVFAAVYLVRFHIAGDYNQTQEFQTEMKEAKAAVDAYMKTAPDMMSKDKVTLLTDAPSIAAGKALFQTNCIACHRADGGGQIGPNLTDQYWINGGGEGWGSLCHEGIFSTCGRRRTVCTSPSFRRFHHGARVMVSLEISWKRPFAIFITKAMLRLMAR